jgi:tetratricopeptide (TPR) repeat protein
MTMRVDRFVASCVVAACLAGAAPVLMAAPDREAADAAFDAGDTARALALYDEILAANPGDIDALLRSGKLLSWDRKYDAALARYEAALTREPKNREVELERGKVLLWSGRYDEAIRGFDRVLKLVPNEPWALCGTGQAYAWSGRGRAGRPYFERALAAQPGMKEAIVGLAASDLEEGDPGAAEARLNGLSATDAADPEVTELRNAAKHARAPWVQVGFERTEDSEDNSMNAYRAEGGVGLPARLDLRVGYAHNDLRGPTPASADAHGNADGLYGVLGWQPRLGHRGELTVGATRLTDNAGLARTIATGGLAYAFPLATWTGRAAISRDPFLYSPRILDFAIDIRSFTFGANGMPSPHSRIEASVGYGDFSDGNTRYTADAGAWYVRRFAQRRSLMAGGAVRYVDFTDDLDHGYFDPSQLIAALLSVRSNGAIGSSPWEYEAAVEAGAQSYTFNGAKATGKPLWSLYGLVARPLPHGLSFQIFAGFGNSSTASGPGFTSRSGGVRLRYTIGG